MKGVDLNKVSSMVFTSRVTAKLLSNINIHSFGQLQGSQYNRNSACARQFVHRHWSSSDS